MDDLSDEAWIVRARAKAAGTGRWDIPQDGDERPKRPALKPRPAPEVQLGVGWRCPSCPGSREMEVFARPGATAKTPLVYCPGCFGFWAAGDALSDGLEGDGFDHSALRALPVPQRCRRCSTALTPLGICAACGWALMQLRCPMCRADLKRTRHESVCLDYCETCRGVWFDATEIIRVYRLEPPAPTGLAARMMKGQRGDVVTASGSTTLPALVDMCAVVLRGLFRRAA
ncbi:MAG: zf-TFIIB domain-containing protein [Dehalococcoidia bacterium]